MSDSAALMQMDALHVRIGRVELLRGVSLNLAQGEILGLVGESGSGKSLTALSIAGLLESPPMQVHAGNILFNGNDMLNASDAEMESVRGNDVAMIFQEPMTSLNPVLTVGDQISEALLLHTSLEKKAALHRAAVLLETVGIQPAAGSLARYPHQLSGGQRQRVMIAMAIACEPKLLIADEPTTALDVTVQAQILELLERLRRDNNMAILLIAHDLGVVRQYCDRVAVMYCGQIVEQGVAQDVFNQPRHPYTQALLRTIPAVNPPGAELPFISGSVPTPDAVPAGCAFAPRCTIANDTCYTDAPVLTDEVHAVRCWTPIHAVTQGLTRS